jgi:hypothetical protein
MKSYRMNARKALLPITAHDPHRSLTADLEALTLLRERVRLAEARLRERSPPIVRIPAKLSWLP